MKLKIERPKWQEIIHKDPSGGYPASLDIWFNEKVLPINKLLSAGVEVYANAGTENLSIYHPFHRSGSTSDTHRALLIDIKPIKTKTREEKLEELVEKIFYCKTWEQVRELEKEAAPLLKEKS